MRSQKLSIFSFVAAVFLSAGLFLSPVIYASESPNLDGWKEIEPPVFVDSIPPQIVIKTPLGGEVIGDVLKVKVEAYDRSYIHKIKIFIDDVKVLVCKDTDTCKISIPRSEFKKGAHTLRVEALDTVKNLATSSLTFVK